MGQLKAPQVKGVILEEFVLRLLSSAGYRILDGSEEAVGVKKKSDGLHLQGRGDWHQTDALVAYDHTPAFIYPIRLIVEAKAYSRNSRNQGRVGLNIIRNAVGVLKDVNENYFSLLDTDSVEHKIKRFNYVYAIFSLNGFTDNAQRYAIAHQIFLFQYYYHDLFGEVRELFEDLEDDNFQTNLSLGDVRETVRHFFASRNDSDIAGLPESIVGLVRSLGVELSKIKGSYFGLLNGEYPIHILSKSEICPVYSDKREVNDGDESCDVRDEEEVEVHLPKRGLVMFRLNNSELSFELPLYLARIFNSVWKDRYELANTKARYINYISLTGHIANRYRNITLRLDRTWLDSYIETLQSR